MRRAEARMLRRRSLAAVRARAACGSRLDPRVAARRRIAERLAAALLEIVLGRIEGVERAQRVQAGARLAFGRVAVRRPGSVAAVDPRLAPAVVALADRDLAA